MDAQRRIEILEAALAEYDASYGFTEKARAALIRPGPPVTEPDTAPFDVPVTRAPKK